MRSRALRMLPAVVLGMILQTAAGQAQDFKKTYEIPAGGAIQVRNVSGDVKITGYNDSKILVLAFKEGPNRDQLQIEDRSVPNRIDLGVHYPQQRNLHASVRFEIRVPASVNYSFDRLASVSGDVEVAGVTGQILAESVSGNVSVTDVNGLVSASSVSGNVLVRISKLTGSGDMSFRSISGNVNVTAPANLDADIEMSTISGSLTTDFPIEVVEKRYVGQAAHGRLGVGSRNLRIKAVSGRVSLVKS